MKPVSSVFEALKTLLQLYGTACAPMLRAGGVGVLDFVARRFATAQVRRCRVVVGRVEFSGGGGGGDGGGGGGLVVIVTVAEIMEQRFF